MNFDLITKSHNFPEKERVVKLLKGELTIVELPGFTEEERQRQHAMRIRLCRQYPYTMLTHTWTKKGEPMYVLRKDMLYEH